MQTQLEKYKTKSRRTKSLDDKPNRPSSHQVTSAPPPDMQWIQTSARTEPGARWGLACSAEPMQVLFSELSYRNSWSHKLQKWLGVFKEVIRGQDLQGAVWGLFSFLLILLITKYFFLMIYEALKGILRNQKHRVLSPWRAETCTWTSVLRSQEGESRGPLED